MLPTFNRIQSYKDEIEEFNKYLAEEEAFLAELELQNEAIDDIELKVRDLLPANKPSLPVTEESIAEQKEEVLSLMEQLKAIKDMMNTEGLKDYRPEIKNLISNLNDEEQKLADTKKELMEIKDLLGYGNVSILPIQRHHLPHKTPQKALQELSEAIEPTLEEQIQELRLLKDKAVAEQELSIALDNKQKHEQQKQDTVISENKAKVTNKLSGMLSKPVLEDELKDEPISGTILLPTEQPTYNRSIYNKGMSSKLNKMNKFLIRRVA